MGIDTQKCINVEIWLGHQVSNIKDVLENIWPDTNQSIKQKGKKRRRRYRHSGRTSLANFTTPGPTKLIPKPTCAALAGHCARPRENRPGRFAYLFQVDLVFNSTLDLYFVLKTWRTRFGHISYWDKTFAQPVLDHFCRTAAFLLQPRSFVDCGRASLFFIYGRANPYRCVIRLLFDVNIGCGCRLCIPLD